MALLSRALVLSADSALALLQTIYSLSTDYPDMILGLVAGIIDEIGIVNKINELIEENNTEKITVEKVVKAMILNGMGLVSSPLYIF